MKFNVLRMMPNDFTQIKQRNEYNTPLFDSRNVRGLPESAANRRKLNSNTNTGLPLKERATRGEGRIKETYLRTATKTTRRPNERSNMQLQSRNRDKQRIGHVRTDRANEEHQVLILIRALFGHLDEPSFVISAIQSFISAAIAVHKKYVRS